MATITLRQQKGSPLTNQEIDDNFSNLNSNKLELSGGTLTGNLSVPQLTSSYSSGDTGGTLLLNKPSSNTTIDTSVSIKLYQNKLQFSETGGTYRGAWLDITGSANDIGSLILTSTNYNSYSPTLGGIGATGTWPISITGNSATVTSITSSQVTSALGYTPYNSSNPNSYISANQTISISGDATGSGTTSIALTLANSGVTAGTYNTLTVDAKGRVTSGSNTSYLPLSGGTLSGTLLVSPSNYAMQSLADGYIGFMDPSHSAGWGVVQGIGARSGDVIWAFGSNGSTGDNDTLYLGIGSITSSSFSTALSFTQNRNATFQVDVRSPIFYDSNNTGYYLDPNSSSALFTLRVYNSFDISSSDVYGNMRVIRNAGSSNLDGMFIGYANSNSGVTRIYGGGASSGELVKHSNYTEEPGSFRAPIFYDSPNTSYYTDPASTSNVNSLTVQGELFASNPTWGGFPLAPNLIHNSYMNKVTGGIPDGYGTLGNITIQAVHPYTKAFEGPYTPSAPSGSVSNPEDATESTPYWYGVYVKGPRISRGGMGDGWHSYGDGKLLKVTGTGIASNYTGAAHCAIYLPKELNNLGVYWIFSAFVKIVKGSAFTVGSDAGYIGINTGYSISKATCDQGPQGWTRYTTMLATSQITSIDGLAISMAILPDANGDIEGYIALPYLANVNYKGTNVDSWSGSVVDKLQRQGVYIQPTDFASEKLQVLANGDVVSVNNLKTPTYYDSNDTSYYVDPNSTSILNFTRFKVSGYPIVDFQNTNPSNYGLIEWTENGNHKMWMGMGGSSQSLGENSAYAQDGFSINHDGSGAFTISNRGGSKWIRLSTGDEGNTGFHTFNVRNGNVIINQNAISYSTHDNTPVVGGGATTNRLHVNGSIQLTNNDDAFVIGRGTATFLKDEELGFGWGGGWYMTDVDWVRVRNNKNIYTTGIIRSDGDVRAPIFYDQPDTSYYLNPAERSRLVAIDTTGGTYNIFRTWTDLPGYHGLYSSVYNGAHFYPNNGSYGAWRMDGSKDSWRGINFADAIVLMMNDNESGHHRNGYGWQFRWNDGTLYCHKNSQGGGTSATVLDSSNYTSYTLPIGGGWYGSGLPGSRWGGYNVNGGEISFGRDLPNTGQMGILVDGCYIAGENNGFWSLSSDNTWGSRRGMYWDGTNLNFTVNSPTASFTRLKVGSGNASSWIDMEDSDEGVRYLHNNSSTIGFVANDGNWSFRVQDAGNTWYRNRGWFDDIVMRKDTNQTMFSGQTSALSFENQSTFFRFAFNKLAFYEWDVGGDMFVIDGGYCLATTSMRAPIFYDSNDPSYYLDPNGSSSLWKPTSSTRERWSAPWRAIDDGNWRPNQTSDSNYWTGTQGWGTNYGNWDASWKYGYCGLDIWGTSTGHPQGSGYVHAQGIQSGLHYANSDGSSAYGWQMVGAADSGSRWWLRGKWGTSTYSWYEIALFNRNVGGDLYASTFYDTSDTDGLIDPVGHSRLKTAGHASSGNVSALEIKNTGGTGDGDVAAISWHCAGYWGLQMHLRHDGYFGIGGWSASTWRWYVNTTNGDMTAAGNITAYSDPRLKQSIKPITNALDKVLQLDGVYFQWKDTSVIGSPGKYDYGVLAPQVEKVAPELVVDSVFTAPEGDKYKTVAYSKLVPILIEAIKEQQQQFDKQQQELQELKNLVKELLTQSR